VHSPGAKAPWKSAAAVLDKRVVYNELAEAVAALLAGEQDEIANAANAVAAIYHTLPDLNWAGVYFARGDELILGPFQGLPACVRIPFGRGVCGTAALNRRSVLVPDVNVFPGHIACDTASRSELVTPIVFEGRLIAVLDLDSPQPARFDELDQAGCETLAEVVAPFLTATICGSG
jgi:L-methionine (R)-S-oxide reductase